MDVMPLVPETKMADARKHSGTHWPEELRGQCLKLSLAFLEPTTGHVFSINTSSSNTLSLLHISLTGPTLSPQCDFPREHYHSLISTNSRQSPQKMYTPCKHSFPHYTLSVRLFPASETEILSNHRKKQAVKIRSQYA